MRLAALLLAAVVLLPTGAVVQDETPVLTVAYVTEEGLWLWQEGGEARLIVAGDVQQPLLSPDGVRVAYRSMLTERGDDLWIVGTGEGDAEAMAITSDDISTDDERRAINQIAWSGDVTLYFNTMSVLPDTLYTFAKNDLWGVAIETGEIKPLLAPGDGGQFAVSPDGAHVAVTRPGRYHEAQTPGAVNLFDAQGASRVDALTFPGVSTASEYEFYPHPHWFPDGSAFRVAIPDPDAVYAYENTPPVALWEVSVEGEARQIGAAPADYFSVVFNEAFWSPDGAHIVYTQRVGAPTENRMALCIAGGDGSNPACHDEGTVGAYAPLGWVPDGSAFVYRIDTADATSMWTLTSGGDRQPFPGEPALELAWVDVETYVYIASVEGKFALRVARLGGDAETIATVEGWPAFSVSPLTP